MCNGGQEGYKVCFFVGVGKLTEKKILLYNFLTFRLLETAPIKECLVTSDSTQQLAHLL